MNWSFHIEQLYLPSPASSLFFPLLTYYDLTSLTRLHPLNISCALRRQTAANRGLFLAGGRGVGLYDG